MARLDGQWKTSSGNGPRQLTKKELAGLTVVVVHIGLILFFVSCISSLTKWYKKTSASMKNRLKSKQKVDIIDVEYEEVTNEQR